MRWRFGSRVGFFSSTPLTSPTTTKTRYAGTTISCQHRWFIGLREDDGPHASLHVDRSHLHRKSVPSNVASATWPLRWPLNGRASIRLAANRLDRQAPSRRAREAGVGDRRPPGPARAVATVPPHHVCVANLRRRARVPAAQDSRGRPPVRTAAVPCGDQRHKPHIHPAFPELAHYDGVSRPSCQSCRQDGHQPFIMGLRQHLQQVWLSTHLPRCGNTAMPPEVAAHGRAFAASTRPLQCPDIGSSHANLG
jgi:hypothetical protein